MSENKHLSVCFDEPGTANLCRHSAKTLIAMKSITDGEIYWVVTNGITKSGMPAFKIKASDQERWRMTLYVKRMMGEHSHAGH